MMNVSYAYIIYLSDINKLKEGCDIFLWQRFYIQNSYLQVKFRVHMCTVNYQTEPSSSIVYLLPSYWSVMNLNYGIARKIKCYHDEVLAKEIIAP